MGIGAQYIDYVIVIEFEKSKNKLLKYDKKYSISMQNFSLICTKELSKNWVHFHGLFFLNLFISSENNTYC